MRAEQNYSTSDFLFIYTCLDVVFHADYESGLIFPHCPTYNEEKVKIMRTFFAFIINRTRRESGILSYRITYSVLETAIFGFLM